MGLPMFTGLIQAVGRVVRVEPSAAGVRLVVDPRPWGYQPAAGDSISISGCCLTVAAPPAGGVWAFDAIPETLSKTTLGGLGAGSTVNLEHAATPATLMGGHIVQGHVDGVAEVVSVQKTPEYRVRIRPLAGLMEFIAPKGSVCVEGVSLTVAGLDPRSGWFEVALIPTTLEKTTLGALRAGDRCNLEADAMAKTIVHWLKHYGPK
jgi:riboflavin synthase